MSTTIPQSRTLTEFERADEIARIERALTGHQRPRTLHALCEQAARFPRCSYCGRKPGRPCTRAGGVSGYHLIRFVQAVTEGLMVPAELATVLGDLDVFTGATVIKDDAR